MISRIRKKNRNFWDLNFFPRIFLLPYGKKEERVLGLYNIFRIFNPIIMLHNAFMHLTGKGNKKQRLENEENKRKFNLKMRVTRKIIESVGFSFLGFFYWLMAVWYTVVFFCYTVYSMFLIQLCVYLLLLLLL